jgi:hypothetical protein
VRTRTQVASLMAMVRTLTPKAMTKKSKSIRAFLKQYT